MSKRIPLLLATLAALPLAALGTGAARVSEPAALAPEALLKERDHSKLGETIAAWIESLENPEKSMSEAREEIHAELEKWRKKRELADRDPLSLTEDLGRALWFSNDYAGAKGIKKGKVAEIEIGALPRGEREIEFAMHAPSKYRAADGPYPLILCIPDKGERPTEHLNQHWTSSDVRDGAILAVVPMPADDSQWSQGEGLANFFTVFREMTRTYAVDYDRLYLAGRGKGVETAMLVAARFPDRFAGVIGRSGDAGTPRCENFSNLPTFFAGAGKQASDFAEASKAAGHENVTIVPDGKEEQVWAWITDHPRVSNPEKVVLVPGTPLPNKAYWVEVPPLDNADGKAMISASVDRASNTVTVDAKGIRQVTLYFNDLMLDLNAPVKVVCNGAEHEDLVPRSLNTFLELVKSTANDPGKLHTASKRYDVPARE